MEKTERMSEKLIRDRSALLGSANTFADVLFSAAGALVAAGRHDHLVKVEDGENYVQVYLADTPADYRGTMRVGEYRVETCVLHTMDSALAELRAKWKEQYTELLKEMQQAAVVNAIEKRNEAARARYQKDLQDSNKDIGRTGAQKKYIGPDVPAFDMVCKMHTTLKNWRRITPDKDSEYTVSCPVMDFGMRLYFNDGMWRYELNYLHNSDNGSSASWIGMLEHVWWYVCSTLGGLHE